MVWLVVGCPGALEGRFEDVFLRKGFEDGSSADILDDQRHRLLHRMITVLSIVLAQSIVVALAGVFGADEELQSCPAVLPKTSVRMAARSSSTSGTLLYHISLKHVWYSQNHSK